MTDAKTELTEGGRPSRKTGPGLQLKYFVLTPHKDNAYGEASRQAMVAYACAIEAENDQLAWELRGWAYEASGIGFSSDEHQAAISHRTNVARTADTNRAELEHIAEQCNAEVVAKGVALARIAELEAQLPDGMQNCTIKFIECPVGHGRLTATNWVQHPCQQCRIAELESALALATEARDRANGDIERLKASQCTEAERKVLNACSRQNIYQGPNVGSPYFCGNDDDRPIALAELARREAAKAKGE